MKRKQRAHDDEEQREADNEFGRKSDDEDDAVCSEQAILPVVF